MSARRRICVVSGTRADYGLLYWPMREIASDPELELQLIVTGMHLSPEFGLTYRQIEADGFVIDARVEMLLSGDTPVALSKSVGLGAIGVSDALDRLRPDIVVILGDRFEMLPVATAALLARIPIAHIHGGETSEGAFDEGIRHAITKMSHWHFVATELYRRRVIQMGESPDRVFNVGAPGLDHMERTPVLPRSELEASLSIAFATPLCLVTYHPATMANESPVASFRKLLAALARRPEATIIFTYPNADTGGRELIALIEEFVAIDTRRRRAVATLGQQRYWSLMREADVIIGNSSSGLIEAPALRKAVVNIGPRQDGRLKADTVIDCADDTDAIAAAIDKALSMEFARTLATAVSPYGYGGASAAIIAHLKGPLPDLRKRFFDVEFAC